MSLRRRTFQAFNEFTLYSGLFLILFRRILHLYLGAPAEIRYTSLRVSSLHLHLCIQSTRHYKINHYKPTMASIHNSIVFLSSPRPAWSRQLLRNSPLKTRLQQVLAELLFLYDRGQLNLDLDWFSGEKCILVSIVWSIGGALKLICRRVNSHFWE